MASLGQPGFNSSGRFIDIMYARICNDKRRARARRTRRENIVNISSSFGRRRYATLEGQRAYEIALSAPIMRDEAIILREAVEAKSQAARAYSWRR